MKRIARAVVRMLPRTALGNHLYYLAYFLWAHRRFPKRNSGLFNDYLFFLKTSGGLDDVLRQFTSDKLLVKQWVDARLGAGFTAKTLAVLDRSNLDGHSIPRNCVIKPTHLSGLVVFALPRPDVADLHLLRQSLSENLDRVSRETNYRNLRPRLICEELIDDPANIVDYKVFCFGGEPRIIQVDLGRHSKHVRTLYAADWTLIDASYSKPRGEPVAEPPLLGQMLSSARTLAQDFESVRIDFYLSKDRIIVGELTHCPEQANGRFGSLDEERRFSEIYFDGARPVFAR